MAFGFYNWRLLAMKVWILAILFFIVIGCTKELIYLPELEKDKVNYYTERLNYEKRIHEENIEMINGSYKKAEELCYVLYHRLPRKRDRYEILAISQKLSRLKKSIATWERMRENYYNAFRLTFTRENVVVGPLKIQFNMEMERMLDFVNQIREIHYRITYLGKFRHEAFLKTGRLEEKLEDFQNSYKGVEKLLKENMDATIERFNNLGVAISRSDNFSFATAEDPGIGEEDFLASGAEELLKDVSEYTYEFEEEQESFSESFSELKESTERFRKALEKLENEPSSEGRNNTEIAHQLSEITTIMEDRLNQIEKLFAQVILEIRRLIGEDIVSVEESLWAKIEAESEAAAKKNNYKYYLNSIYQLSNTLKKTLEINDPDSDAAKIHSRILELGKYFNESTGMWSTGFDHLNKEWQEKVSFKKLGKKLQDNFFEAENVMKEPLNRLWKTCFYRYKQGQKPPYKMQDGYLSKND